MTIFKALSEAVPCRESSTKQLPTVDNSITHKDHGMMQPFFQLNQLGKGFLSPRLERGRQTLLIQNLVKSKLPITVQVRCISCITSTFEIWQISLRPTPCLWLTKFSRAFFTSKEPYQISFLLELELLNLAVSTNLGHCTIANDTSYSCSQGFSLRKVHCFYQHHYVNICNVKTAD